MDWITWLIVALVSLAFSALFSGTEIAYITGDRVVMGLDVKKGGFIGRIVGLFYGHQELFISTILVGNNVMLVIYGMGAAELIEHYWLARYNLNQGLLLLISTLVSTLVILLMGEFFPKSVFRINPNTSLKLFAIPVFLFYLILYPISAFTSWISKALMRLAGVKSEKAPLGALSVSDLNSYLDRTLDDVKTPQEDEVEDEVKMFHNALDFSKTILRDCMVPRNEIVAVDIDETTRESLSELFTESGRSKIIVYREDIDNVVGYIHVSELFDTAVDWKERLKPVVYAPETLLANKMMRRLLNEKRSVAIVVDEFGGTSGLITLEDLVEEIFGDIRDEHDADVAEARELAPGVYEFSGRIEVRTLRDDYRLDIPEEDDYQTLAGYILFNTGAIPEEGQTVILGPLAFTVTRRSATRLELIRVEPAPDNDSADADN